MQRLLSALLEERTNDQTSSMQIPKTTLDGYQRFLVS